jgi:hexokinase
VDLGGTNFRVLRVQLDGKGGRILKQETEQVRIPHEVMTGTSKVNTHLGTSSLSFFFFFFFSHTAVSFSWNNFCLVYVIAGSF